MIIPLQASILMGREHDWEEPKLLLLDAILDDTTSAIKDIADDDNDYVTLLALFSSGVVKCIGHYFDKFSPESGCVAIGEKCAHDVQVQLIQLFSDLKKATENKI